MPPSKQLFLPYKQVQKKMPNNPPPPPGFLQTLPHPTARYEMYPILIILGQVDGRCAWGLARLPSQLVLTCLSLVRFLSVR